MMRRSLPTLGRRVLAHEWLGDPHAECTLLVLHGLLGSRKNFRGAAKKLIEQANANSSPLLSSSKQFNCLLLDLRGHGESGILSGRSPPALLLPPHNMSAVGHDISDAVFALTGGKGVDVTLGHSFGGKAALAFLRKTLTVDCHKLPAPKHTIVLDAVPGTVDRARASGESNSVKDVLAAVGEVQIPIKDKDELISFLKFKGISHNVCLWMTTNMKPRDDGRGFEFAFDLPTVLDLFESYGETDFFPFLENLQSEWTKMEVNPKIASPKVHIIKAGKNDIWRDAAIAHRLDEAIRASPAMVDAATIEGAGHWVHVDKLQELINCIVPCFVDAANTRTTNLRTGLV